MLNLVLTILPSWMQKCSIKIKKNKILLGVTMTIKKLWLFVKVAVWGNTLNQFNSVSWVNFKQKNHVKFLGQNKKKIEGKSFFMSQKNLSINN